MLFTLQSVAIVSFGASSLLNGDIQGQATYFALRDEVSVMPVVTKVDVRQEVTTKEELDDLRNRLKDLKGEASNAATGATLNGKPITGRMTLMVL
jgi:hypothetical protein